MVKDKRPSIVRSSIRKDSKWQFIDSDTKKYTVEDARNRWKSREFNKGHKVITRIVKKKGKLTASGIVYVAKGKVVGKRKR